MTVRQLPPRRLLLVHAHPDDECITTGGTIARYAREDDTHVCLVTCTDGQLGEVWEELPDADAIRERLADVRREELRAALRCLGQVELRLLGYHDSGMDGEPTNEAPEAFVRQPLEDVVRELVAILRDVRPQVVVTYNDFGFYGHPDHIRAHDATMAAVERAAEPDHAPELGDAHRVAKVYHTAVPKSALRQAREIMTSSPQQEFSVEELFSEEEIERIGTDDDEITADLDVLDHVEAKVCALAAHRTQYGTVRAFLEIPEGMRREWLRHETYVLARSEVGPPDGVEDDLFRGVEQ